MSVYPEKRFGKPTGKWVAEVLADGTLYQSVLASREAAKVEEKRLRRGKKDAPNEHNVIHLRATNENDYSAEGLIARGLVCLRFLDHLPAEGARRSRMEARRRDTADKRQTNKNNKRSL